MNEDMSNNEAEAMQTCAINEFCRLCANLDDNMVSIYADEGADHMLENKIKIHLPFINISKNDLLPKKICYHCASTVLVWNELYECSSEADQKLRSMFGVNSYEQSDCKIIQEDERLNPSLKRYINLPESDATFKVIHSKTTLLSTNYSCAFCPETFLKIRDKNKHDCDVHGVQTNLLPIKYVSDKLDKLKVENNKDNDTNKDISKIDNVNETNITQDSEKNYCDLLCVECDTCFVTSLEKLKHDQKLHKSQLEVRRSSRIATSKKYKNILYEEADFDTETQNSSLNSEQLNNSNVLSKAVDERNVGINISKDLEEIKNEPGYSDVRSDDGNYYKCYYCNERFISKNLALKHVRIHKIKNKKAKSKNDIYDKFKVIIDNKIFYKCDQCNYAVEGRRYKFVYHMRVHTGEKPYTCEICSKKFRTAAFLRRHIVCFHERIRSYQCDICGRSFSEKRNVDDHRRTHTGERPFVCETCGKCFAQRSSMKIHWKQMHESIKSHKCEYCEKSFIRKCHLVAHLTHHTGVRNYVCAVCGKAFLRSGTLKGHTAVHSSERPFRCTICGDTFKLKKHLKQHGRVHGNQHTFGHLPQFQFNPNLSQ